MKRTLTLEPRVAVPAVVAALALTLLTGWQLGRSSQAPAAVPAVPAILAIPAAPAAPPDAGTVATSTPEAILEGIPDTGKPTAASKEVQRWRDAARKHPERAKNWVNLGDALMQLSREQADQHPYDWAKLCYEQALGLDQKYVGAMTGLAWISGSLHDFDTSIAWAKKAIDLNPEAPEPYGLIGDAQLETGDYDGAFESYQKMLDLRPDMSSYSRGAHLLYITGDTRKAIWLMSKAVQAGSPYGENVAWCKAQLAEMLWNRGALVPAANTVAAALKAAPENYHLLTIQGHILEAQKNPTGAIAAYQKAIQVSPQHKALVALGDLYLSLGKKEEAEKLFAQVETAHQHHQTHGNHDELYMARFWADHDRNLKKALEVVEARLESRGEPRSLADLETVAWVYHKTGKNQEALRLIKKAVARNVPDASRLYRAGMIHLQAGEARKAQQYLRQTLDLNPTFHPIQARQAAEAIRTAARQLKVTRTASR